MFRRKKNRGEEGGLVAKLRRRATDLAKDPKVRREARRGAGRLASDPRVQRKARKWAARAMQRLRRH